LTDTKHEDDKELPPYHHDTLEQSKMVYCQPSLLEPISTLIEHLNEETTSHSSHGMKRKIQGSVIKKKCAILFFHTFIQELIIT